MVDVELLWWAGCPSTQRALLELRAALEEVGLDGLEVRTREIGSEAAAAEAGFRGSPTIRVDGVDVPPASGDEPVGLTCRVYHRRDGRIAPTPDPRDVREALRRAASRQEASR